MLEKRGPYRGDHIRLANQMVVEKRCLSGGPFSDCDNGSDIDDIPTGALFVFADEDSAKEFVRLDSYVEHGIVTHWNVKEWTVIV